MQEREYIQCYALLLVDSLYALNCSNIRCTIFIFNYKYSNTSTDITIKGPCNLPRRVPGLTIFINFVFWSHKIKLLQVSLTFFWLKQQEFVVFSVWEHYYTPVPVQNSHFHYNPVVLIIPDL